MGISIGYLPALLTNLPTHRPTDPPTDLPIGWPPNPPADWPINLLTLGPTSDQPTGWPNGEPIDRPSWVGYKNTKVWDRYQHRLSPSFAEPSEHFGYQLGLCPGFSSPRILIVMCVMGISIGYLPVFFIPQNILGISLGYLLVSVLPEY